MAELADARDSKPRDGDIMRVQLPLPAPEWNLAVENQRRCGRRKPPPTPLRLIFQTNSACAKKMLFLGVFKNHCRIGQIIVLLFTKLSSVKCHPRYPQRSSIIPPYV